MEFSAGVATRAAAFRPRSGLLAHRRPSVAALLVAAILGSVLSLETGGVAEAAPTAVDPRVDQSFGGGTVEVIPGPTGPNDRPQIVVDELDRAYVAHKVRNGTGANIVVDRLTADGVHDPSFERTTIDTSWQDDLRDMTLAPDGSGVYLLMWSYPSAYVGFQRVVKVSAVGGLDQSFGLEGWVNLPSPWTFDRLDVAPDGKVVVAGRRYEAGDTVRGWVHVVRLNATGGYDLSFGVGGRMTYGPLERSPIVTDLAVDSDGTTFVVSSGIGDPAIVSKVTPSGVLDVRFGNDGLLYVTREDPDGGNNFDSWAVAVLDDRIIVGGGPAFANASAQVTVRDKRSGGRISGSHFSGNRVQGLMAAPDGSVWAAGQIHQGIVRLYPDGTPERQLSGVDVSMAYGSSMAVDNQGRVLVARTAGDDPLTTVTRYLAPPPLPPMGNLTISPGRDVYRAGESVTIRARYNLPGGGTPSLLRPLPIRFDVVDGPMTGWTSDDYGCSYEPSGICSLMMGTGLWWFPTVLQQPGIATVRAWVDLNNNGRYDPGIDPMAVTSVRIVDTPVDHAGLGDSFSAGTGVEPQMGHCERSFQAYAWPVHQYVDQGLSFPDVSWSYYHRQLPAGFLHFVACGGAKSHQVLDDEQVQDEGPQLNQLTGPVDLITFTIGGNDFGFSDVVTACYAAFSGPPCGAPTIEEHLASPATAATLQAFRANMTTAVAEMRTRGRPGREPTIVMSGYPHLVGGVNCRANRIIVPTFDERGGVEVQLLTEREMGFLNGGVDWLNGQLATLADELGIHFVDPRPYFGGRGFCTEDPRGELINGLVRDRRPRSERDSLIPIDSATYHPNGAGQAMYARAIIDYLGGWTGSRHADTALPHNPAPAGATGMSSALSAPVRSYGSPDALRPHLSIRPIDGDRCEPIVLDGDTVVLVGGGFPAGQTMTVEVETPGITQLQTQVTADGGGELDAEVTLPVLGGDAVVRVVMSYDLGGEAKELARLLWIYERWDTCFDPLSVDATPGTLVTIDLPASAETGPEGWSSFELIESRPDVAVDLDPQSGAMAIPIPGWFDGDLEVDVVLCARSDIECVESTVTVSVDRQCTIVGTDDDDVIYGTEGDDVICAGAGNDVIHAVGGNNIIYAVAGSNVIYGGPGNDTIFGGIGDDVAHGGGGVNHIDLGPGFNIDLSDAPSEFPDVIAPVIEVVSPQAGDVFFVGEGVAPSFECRDEGLVASGVDSCEMSPGSIDTSTPGERSITITTVDNAGNADEVTVSFTVVDAPSYPDTILADEPLAYWRFDETVGSNEAVDQVGGRSAVLWSNTHMVEPGLVGEPGDRHLSVSGGFRGGATYTGSPGWLGGAQAMTIEAWIDADSTGNDRGFLSAATSYGHLFVRHAAQGQDGRTNIIRAGIPTTWGPIWVESSEGVQRSGPMHVALRWQAGRALELYIDGELDTGALASNPVSGATVGIETLIIGRGPTDYVTSWHGAVDELAIYDVALSSERIALRSRVGRLDGGDPDPDPDPDPDLQPTSYGDAVLASGPIAYWRFDEPLGVAVVSDAVGGRTATLAGSASVQAPGLVGDDADHHLQVNGGFRSAATHADVAGWINGSSSFTVEAWIDADAIGNNRGFLSGMTPSGTDRNLFIRNVQQGQNGRTNVIRAGIPTSMGTAWVESSSGAQRTSRTHIVVRWTTGQPLELFIDGVRDTGALTSGPGLGTVSGIQTLIIGRGPLDVFAAWQGSIDEFAVYDLALSDERITLHHQMGIR